jgi:hypothetical protein
MRRSVRACVQYSDVMSQSRPISTQGDLQALKVLQADASELERIESLLDQFNVFEAIGFMGQEVMHSRFLVFLLDPNQSHGLEDLFLKRLLREVFATSDTASFPILFEDIDELDLGQTLVRREHQYIDILLTNEAHKLAVIIENKVWTTEHSDQLERYYRVVQHSHPDWRVFGIYLTPLGDIPSHEVYLPFGYAAVCEIVDSILEARGSALDPEVQMTLKHYTEMVRRNIVGDSEIARLCQRLYQEHQRAFDLVFQHRFATQETIRRTLVRLIGQTPGLIHDGGWINYPSEGYVDFAVQEWDVPQLLVGSRRDRGNRILEFVFGNYPDYLLLDLQIRPGDEATRRKLFEMAHANRDVFDFARDSLSDYANIFRRTILSSSFYEDGVQDKDREQEIRRQWVEFIERDLPQIEAALKKETWIWKPVEPEERT